jgi:menaquinone-dependent protoporphyrinogen oxidase
MKRILVAFGSRRGSTAEIAASIAAALRDHGFAVDCARASEFRDIAVYDAVIVGGALYAGRWIREARRFVIRHAPALRARPVWLFSSGPLDASANDRQLGPVPRVAALARWIGARGHATFGGRLAPDASGVLASAMAKKLAGDWRDWPQIRAWAQQVAHAIDTAPLRSALPAATPVRWPLAALCFAVAATSIAGGAALTLSPDGSLLHAPRSLLAHTPFSSFLIPGLLLLLVVGLTGAVAGVRVVRDIPGANATALVAGAALVVWIAVEMMLFRSAHWLQLSCLIAGSLIIMESLRRWAWSP